MRLLFITVLLAGCFDPQIPSGGFTCSPPDHAQCPEGFSCVNNLCVQGTSQIVNLPDLTDPDSFTESAPDLGHDLAKAMCVASGGDCTYHRDAVCCSGSCIYSTNKCK
jgi:hypothetical protein